MNINTGIFTSDVAVGGDGSGHQFYYGVPSGTRGVPSSGTTIRSLQFWYNGNTVRGIEIRLSDGGQHTFGKLEDSRTDRFYFSEGEEVSSLKIWSSDHGRGRCGRIELSTNQGRSFVVPSRATGDPYVPEVGSGKLLGVFGRDGDDIDCLGFGLLRRIQSAKLTDIQYPTLDEQIIKTNPRVIKQLAYDNLGDSQQKFTFSGSKEVTVTQTWSRTASMEFGISATVEASIPFLGSASSTSSLTLGGSKTYSRENVQKETDSFQYEVNVNPHTKVEAAATIYEGKINLDYTGNMAYFLDSGAEFSYQVKGCYSGVSVSKAQVTTRNI